MKELKRKTFFKILLFLTLTILISFMTASQIFAYDYTCYGEAENEGNSEDGNQTFVFEHDAVFVEKLKEYNNTYNTAHGLSTENDVNLLKNAMKKSVLLVRHMWIRASSLYTSLTMDVFWGFISILQTMLARIQIMVKTVLLIVRITRLSNMIIIMRWTFKITYLKSKYITLVHIAVRVRTIKMHLFTTIISSMTIKHTKRQG